MSKNLTRRGLALGAGLALSASSLVGVVAPASAATGDVSIAPTAGTGTTAFATDNFELLTTVKTTVVAAGTLAYKISNPDQNQLSINVNNGTSGTDQYDVIGYKADGSAVTTGLGADKNADQNVVVDFADLGITSLVIYNVEDGGTDTSDATTNALSFRLDEAATTNTAYNQAENPLEYGDLLSPTTVTVTAWVETTATPNYATVDTDYMSEVAVTFVDPNTVSVVSKVEKIFGATGDQGLEIATDVATAYLDNGSTAIGVLADAGATVDGVVLEVGDKVLVDSTTSGDNGLWTVAADTDAGSVAAATTSKHYYIQEGTVNAGKVITGAANTVAFAEYTTSGTISNFNSTGDNYLSGSLRFSNTTINLAQVDLAKWDYALDSTAADDLPYSTGAGLRTATPAGHSAVDSMGRLFVGIAALDLALDVSDTYKMKFRHAELTTTDYISGGFQVITSPSGAADKISAAPTDAVNAVVSTTYDSGYLTAVRNGTSAVTWSSQVYANDGTTKTEVANIPVIAVVTAGSAFVAGETLSVSGSTEKITTSSGTMVVTGLTTSKGVYSVTVTSSDSSSAGAAYTVQFYALDNTGNTWVTAAPSNSAIYKVDYATSVLASSNAFTADSEVASGSSVSVTFTVVDQFGSPLSASATGAGYSVMLTAPDTTKLKESAAIVDGTATITFDNYLTAGGSDVVTAKLFTGSATSPSYVTGQVDSITVYNTNAVTGVNVSASITGVSVVYADFFNGKASATKVAPADSAKTAFTGTVVDANGAGVPGAPVTIAATGFAFLNGTTYAVDTISLNADAAGAFSVSLWTHVASATGVDITVTSGTVTAKTVLKSAVPAGDGLLSAKNLKLSWNLPTATVMNSTYAVTATVTDVWGNPIKNASVKFSGYAAANFNAASTATKSTSAAGTATAYLRSIKDVDGLAAIALDLLSVDQDSDTAADVDDLATVFLDVTTTSWDESAWTSSLEAEITFAKTAADVVSTDQKVNAGSFKGYVAVYAKGHMGSKLSAKIGNDWVIVESLASNFVRTVDFTGAGVDIAVRIYIDTVLIDTINLVTK